MRLDIIRQQRQFLISRVPIKLYWNTYQSVIYVLTTKTVKRVHINFDLFFDFKSYIIISNKFKLK